MKKMNKNIGLGSKDYTLRMEPSSNEIPDHIYSAALLGGYFHEQDQLIYIDTNKKYSNQQVIEALIHELLHAVYYEYCIEDKHNEEETVTRLAKGFCGVLKNNPIIMKLIKEGLDV